MKLPLEGIKKIHVHCDRSGRATLCFFYENGGGGKFLLPGDEVIFSGAMPSAGEPTDTEEPQSLSLKGIADSLRAIQTILERRDAEKKMADEALYNACRPTNPYHHRG